MQPHILLEEIFTSLKVGRTIPKHPYRYVNLATSVDNKIFQRMVVFRKIEKNCITIYTDSRTPKVSQLKSNSNASLLFWDYKRMTQIQLQGKVAINLEKDTSIWNNLPEKAKEDYSATKVPGSELSSSNEIQFFEEENFFCKLQFHITEIDYLKINKPHHIRAKFTLENEQWEGNYVVP